MFSLQLTRFDSDSVREKEEKPTLVAMRDKGKNDSDSPST
jgi:hypothetical protein